MIKTTKRCPRCKQIKFRIEFPKDENRFGGIRSWCVDCYREHAREYAHSERGKARRHTEDFKKRFKVHRQKYLKSEKGIAQGRRQVAKYTERYPEKRKAQKAVWYAKSKGKIPDPKTMTCVNCGNQAAQYHHHQGYSQEHWFDIVPVCVPCHSRIHRLMTHS